jgi:GST-like protein
MNEFTLYGRPGWGSALVEAQLVWYGHKFEPVDFDNLFTSAEARAKLAKVNPLAQVPTLQMPDGSVMTESAAITLLLADGAGAKSLVPPPGDGNRAQFLRWLVFLVANIYPTFTYADDPNRFVGDKSAQGDYEVRIKVYREKLWHIVEDVAGAPFFLGEKMTALDIYIAVMTHWTPKRAWFVKQCPKLTAIAHRVEALPQLQPVWLRHFPKG